METLNITKKEDLTLQEEWDQNFEKAEDTESPTLRATMEASYKDVASVEVYLAEKGDSISDAERAFLESSIKMKQQSVEGRVADSKKADAIQAELTQRPRAEQDEIQESAEGRSARYDRIHEELEALRALKDTSLKGWFRRLTSRPVYTEQEKVETKEGRGLVVVIDGKGEKFVRLDIYNSTGDEGYRGRLQERLYIPYEKAEPFLAR